MSEITELAVIEKSNAMTIFTQEDNLEKIVEETEKTTRSLVAFASGKVTDQGIKY